MSNEQIPRNGTMGQGYLDSMVQAGIGGHQALVLSAFVEQRRAWEKEQVEIREDFLNKQKEYKRLVWIYNHESSAIKFIYNKLLRRSSPAERQLSIIKEELNEVASKMLKHQDTEPDLISYELAAWGNNLFKPR